MTLEDIKKVRQQLYQIAAKHGIKKVFMVGSVARGSSDADSDVDFLIEMVHNASALGIGGFQFEAQQLSFNIPHML